MNHIADPNLRNIAIIAHVDHGKTTLVDALLADSGTLDRTRRDEKCILDSNPLEKERGITIFSKNCALNYRPEHGSHAGTNFRINLIDTPGHADFGGEVERVLKMADGVLLLVDAFEGPMPQTRFVLQKALDLKLKIIVVVNKCDRPDARPDEVVDEVFDLLVALGADDETLDFEVIFASGKEGWASRSYDNPGDNVKPLLDCIVDYLPAPGGDPDAPLQMLITTLDYSEYVGRIAIGRIYAGSISSGQVITIYHHGDQKRTARALKIYRFEGLGRKPAEVLSAGNLCAVEGLGDFEIGDTIACPNDPAPLQRVYVDEPTLSMTFRINDSPFAGQDGKYVTSRQIAERLEKELRTNVALRVEPGNSADEFRVSGRGLLHLGVLLENMRREGYELAVGRPEVIEREIDGQRCEPYERLTIDVSPEALGATMELLGPRGADIETVEPRGDRMHIECEIPARSLIGLRSRLLTATAGEAVMYHTFQRYAPVRQVQQKRTNGVLIATETGKATMYALVNLADRGIMFIKPQEPVYAGQIVGEHNRETDLPVNIARTKAHSNVREATKEATVTLKTPRQLTLEAALEYIASDELVEITPKVVRLRKKLLSENERKRAQRAAKSQIAQS